MVPVGLGPAQEAAERMPQQALARVPGVAGRSRSFGRTAVGSEWRPFVAAAGLVTRFHRMGCWRELARLRCSHSPPVGLVRQMSKMHSNRSLRQVGVPVQVLPAFRTDLRKFGRPQEQVRAGTAKQQWQGGVPVLQTD